MEIQIFGEVSSLLRDLTDSMGYMGGSPPTANIFVRRPSTVVPQIPRPLSTSGFPLARRSCSKRWRETDPPTARSFQAENCPVCLETVKAGSTADTVLPCGHHMHRACAYGLLTLPVLGADAMMRCPLCRCTLDRYDLEGMGLDVSPSQLRGIARRCDAVRALGAGGGMTATYQPDYASVAQLVRTCAGARASDGFVYNTVLLSIERAIFHRRGLAKGIAAQLRRSPSASREDELDYIAGAVACHVQVLAETSHATDEEYFE